MANTAITTTARRITRELNSLPAHTTVAFDADGRVEGRVYGQGIDVSHLDGAAHIFQSRSDSRLGTAWTQSDVQTILDDDAQAVLDNADA